MRIAIVGAGLSGLATAFYVQRARPDWEITIFESEASPGGTMQTAAVDGFRFEAGGNGFLTNKPDSLRLVEDSGAKDLLQPSSDLARKRFIFTDQLHRLPESPQLFLGTKLITLPQKLRVLGELIVPPRRDGKDETLQEFGYRRLGRGMTDVFLDAMVAGIYGSTPAKISVRAAFPLIVGLERDHGGLFRGMLAKRKKEAGPGGVLVSFRGGVGAFIEHLRSSIRADWRLGAPVTDITRVGNRYQVGGASGFVEADQVVIGAQSYAAAGMVSGLDRELSARLAAIQHSPIAVVGFGYRKSPRELDGFGLLTTTSAKQPVLGVLWDSSIFPDRAPAGGAALRAMLGGQRNPELVEQDESRLVANAQAGIRNTMGVDREPDVVYVKRWPRGIPSYTPGHVDRVNAIFEQLTRWPGLHVNCNAYRGIAMNDCSRNGRELAEKITA